MSELSDDIAHAVRIARVERSLTPAQLAELSGVSRAMISKIERNEAQPTAALLARLATALGLTLSELIARAEGAGSRLARRDEQAEWTDPATGFTRRSVSPGAATTVELVEVVLPAGAEVAYPADSYRFIDQQIWVLSGTLHFQEGDELHVLAAGDCLQLAEPRDCVFRSAADEPCRYLVALSKAPTARR